LKRQPTQSILDRRQRQTDLADFAGERFRTHGYRR
jgi:hypothetical protein